MADSKNSIEHEIKERLSKERENLESVYRDTVKKLEKERERLSDELHKEYDHVKKYVSEHPEVGVGSAFAGGLLIGIIIAKLLKK